MRMRFERNVSRAATRLFAGYCKRNRLGVIQLFKDIKTFAYDLALRASYHTPDKWSRTYLAHALLRQIQRPRHHATISFGHQLPNKLFTY